MCHCALTALALQRSPSQRLFEAAAAGNADAVVALLREGVDVHSVNEGGNEPIHVAAYDGHVRVLEALLDAGAHVMHSLSCTLMCS